MAALALKFCLALAGAIAEAVGLFCCKIENY
jgi:hypothetical protein